MCVKEGSQPDVSNKEGGAPAVAPRWPVFAHLAARLHSPHSKLAMLIARCGSKDVGHRPAKTSWFQHAGDIDLHPKIHDILFNTVRVPPPCTVRVSLRTKYSQKLISLHIERLQLEFRLPSSLWVGPHSALRCVLSLFS